MTTTEEQAARLAIADVRSFDDTTAGPRRRAALANHTRAWLAGLWRGATAGMRTDGVALAAVGSLGRDDPGPLSDVDLVLLHSGRVLSESAINALADRIWYPIWDAGVKLDHSVRTVAQCRSVAQADLTATIGLLDLSWVAGDRELVTAARATVAHDWRGAARRRLPEMLESLAARHTRHGDLAQSLEPEIKEAKGGLRDLTILAALAEAWLAQRPRGEVVTATGLLLDVRDAIHVVTGRGRDRLLRQDHDAVAALLGHDDADDLLTEISDAGRVIAHSLDAAMRRASQAQRARLLRVGPRRPQMTPLGYGLFVSDGELVLGHDRLLTDPVLPLRAAVLAATHGVPIAPATLTNLAKVPPLPVPWPDEAREQLGNLLASGPGLVPVWEGLDQAGIIGSWFPEWSTVRSRPQRSPVHRHTVDRHLVETVVHAGGMVREVSRPDLLLIAALLHDIGKVKGARDHSLEGAPLARAIVERMGHPEADVALVERLVREHLTLVELATRRDHADPGTVEAAISASGGTLAGFDLLRALTEADAAAAGPAAWTDWRSSLVAQLTTAVRARLDPDAPEPDDPAPRAQPADVERAVRAGRVHVEARSSGSAWRLDIISTDRLGLFADTAGVLAVEGLIVRTAIVRTLDGLAVNEWHVESPRVENPDPARIGRLIERLATGDLSPLVALEKRRNRPTRPSATADTASPGQARAMIVPGASPDATVLEVRAQDRPALLHDLGRTFTRAGISVRSAHVATYAGQTLDTFYLTDVADRPLAPAQVAQVVGLVIDTCES